MKKQMNNTERIISAIGTIIILIAALFLKMNIPILIIGFVIVLFSRPIAKIFDNSKSKKSK
ncbi:MAG: hypothetical protein M3Z38_05375 [Bombilactobacillus mellifer]|nr:hypothetical protein [Bombilactobacillus mellifer]